MKLRILILSFVALTFVAGCKKKEEPTTTTTNTTNTTTVATPSVNAITMASKVDADNNPTNSTTTFGKKDTIWAVADIDGTSVGTPVEARWFHTTSNTQINSNTVTARSAGMHRLPFFIAKPDGWPTGDYRVDILINGSVMKSATFQVQ
jgi:hypothetical protein